MFKFIVIAFLTLFVGCSRPEVIPSITGNEGKEMPTLNILLADSVRYFSTDSIPLNKATILFYFSPSCPYCRMEMRSIINEIDKVKDIHFCLITNSSFSEMRNFAKQYKIEEYHNISLGIDTGHVFASYYNAKQVPFLAIYGKDRRLKQSFIGVVSIKQLMNSIRL